MKKPCKISASTMARTAALALALTNQLLSCTGHSVLPIESEQLEQLVSTGITVAAAAGELVGEQQLHPRSH